MEARLWSRRDHVLNSKTIFQLLKKRITNEINIRCRCSQSEKNNLLNESDLFLCKPNERRLSAKKLLKKPEKHSQDELENRKPQHVNSKIGKQRNQNHAQRILSALTSDAQVHSCNKTRGGGVIFSSLMYKTYMNLKDKDLIHVGPQSTDLDLGCQTLHWSKLHSTNNPRQKCDDFDISGKTELEGTFLEETCDIDSTFDTKLTNLTFEDTNLWEKMCNKYQDPSQETVKQLTKRFPEPDKLFHDVMRPAQEAGLPCHEALTVSNHLRSFYWKAKIRLLWPRAVTVTGVHTDRQNAITRVYLLACAQLKDLGLIVEGPNSIVQPVKCDSVISMLEQIGEYSDSTIQGSRGKGFKIILEKVKNCLDHSDEDVLCYNHLDDKVCCEWHGCKNKDDSPSKWSCCVHVGWPTPFSVRMVAPSLPSAQMLALQTVASNLKLIGVLNRTNEKLNPLALQKAVLRETTNEWGKCMQSFQATNQIEQYLIHDAYAIIHVDASNIGYGAYLKFKDSEKVSWLSELWLHQPQVFSKIHSCSNERFSLHSTVAELFACVSTIFSWKRKLQHRKLLCFSDNQTAVTLLTTSTLKSNQPSNSNKCISVYDSLVSTLQDTCHSYNIQLHAAWIPRQQNWLADRLANGDVQVFMTAVPHAVARKTKVKHLQLKDDLSQVI